MERPEPRFTMITLGVSDMRRSIAFYAALGFKRKLAATGEQVAFFETGGTMIGLFGQDGLAKETGLAAGLQRAPVQGFRGVTLAWNCRDKAEVDAVVAFVETCGATIVNPAQDTDYGGYTGYFADPDGHVWEAVVAPGIDVGADRRVHLAD